MVGVMNSPEHHDESISVIDEVNAQLLAVEFESLPFIVRRIFVVSSQGVSVGRGNHLAGCNQLLILLSGKVSLSLLRPDKKISNLHLNEVGNSALIQPDDFVTYELLDSQSRILVLADKSYAEAFANRKK